MAQGVVAMPPAANGTSLNAEELREIVELEKIVQFRDSIFAGTHPRIKIPAHLLAKRNGSTRNISSPSSSTTPRANLPAKLPTSSPSTRTEESSSFFNKPSYPRFGGGAAPMSSNSEINPVLLEKSDDLIKAEIQLSRQKLERGLREQIEKQRLETKALLQTSESLPNFDLSEVLSKALEIVHPSATTTGDDPSVGARSSASDSFDDNTFYSSQHESPIPSPQAQKESVALQSHSRVVDDISTENESTQTQVEDRDMVMTGASLVNSNYTDRQLQLMLRNTKENSDLQGLRSSNSDSSNNRETRAQADTRDSSTNPRGEAAHPDPLRQVFDKAAASPLMRAHNLSPLAPQPSRVSPLATARDPPILRDSTAIEEVQPPQVTALRTQMAGVSSTDSSPKGAKGPEKKKKKDKKGKRKAKDSVDIPDSPYIKPEPRSPSPYGVAPLPRPQKRQRQSGQYAAELNYDEPRYETDGGMSGRVLEPYKEVPGRREYERVEQPYEPEIRRSEPTYRRVEDTDYRRAEDEYRRTDGAEYTRGPASPSTVYALPYAPTEMRSVRAGSHAITERKVYEEPRYYREPVIRASVRPDADRERSRSPLLRERRSPIMRPPPRPLRLVVDEYGREFYEPIPASSMRQSMAPPMRYREPEVVYERAPVRSISGRAPTEVYEDDAVVYRRPSPTLAAPRRVVTQPEYAIPPQSEYREYRQREYSVRPSAMAPPGEVYAQVRAAPEGREMSHFEEPPREYIRRAASVRPEAVRYEIPREYAGRMPSVRPSDLPPREYAASVRPEPRREVVAQGQREYSVRPVEPMPPSREQAAGPDGRYYEDPASGRPAEIAFIERPRARESSVLVYADDVRREVYR